MIFANMLNKKASKTGLKIIEQLNISKGNIVADIGSGGGYFVYQFAEKVGPRGIVYAVDTNPKLLSFIDDNVKKMNYGNVKTVMTEENTPCLPDNHFDLVFMSNVFHHIKSPVEYYTNLKKCLKNDGKIAIIDYDERNRFSYIALTGHTTKEETILETMVVAGYKHLSCCPVLDKQSFNIFSCDL